MGDVYLNGEYLPLEEARVPVMDRGFLFGDGVYEVIPVYESRPFRLTEHLDRLDNSLHAIRMGNPRSRDSWAEILQRLTAPTPELDQLIYLQLTRGVDPARNHLFPQGAEPTIFVMAWPAKPRDPEIAEKGIPAIVLDDNRWTRCDIKAIALLGNVLLRQQAEDAGAGESLLIRDGLLTEGSSTNPFLVKDGEILTPPKSNRILPGVTRDLVLELAREEGIPCTERDIAENELKTADEIWISSSSREVQPVTLLNGTQVGAGVPGPMWKRIDALFQEYKARV